MRLVVADTSPIFYLLSIGQIDLLPRLFGKVLIPDAMHREMRHPSAPATIREWVTQVPSWMDIAPAGVLDDPALAPLGAGERAAIVLAISLRADLILIDERKGSTVALSKGFDVTGTLGVLRLAARRGFVDLADCFERLKGTNFRYRQKIMDELLAQPADDCVS